MIIGFDFGVFINVSFCRFVTTFPQFEYKFPVIAHSLHSVTTLNHVNSEY